MSRPCLVLCEDKQQSAFIGRFLKKKKMPADIEKAPHGKGSAAGYVLANYPKYLKKARKKGLALIVMIDGDNLDADKRMRKLEDECQKRGVDGRGKAEPVAIFVPEADVEDWIHHLLGDGKTGKLQRERDCVPAVKKLADICEKGKSPADFPPSLSRACDEWRQFRKVAP